MIAACSCLSVAFYLEKQTRRGGKEQNWVEAIKINPAECVSAFTSFSYIRCTPFVLQKLGYVRFIYYCKPFPQSFVVWNMHSRVAASIAQYRIGSLTALTPPVSDQRLENQGLPPGLLPVRSEPNAKLSHDDLDNPEELAVRALL